jgi:hypothetical protein
VRVRAGNSPQSRNRRTDDREYQPDPVDAPSEKQVFGRQVAIRNIIEDSQTLCGSG